MSNNINGFNIDYVKSTIPNVEKLCNEVSKISEFIDSNIIMSQNDNEDESKPLSKSKTKQLQMPEQKNYGVIRKVDPDYQLPSFFNSTIKGESLHHSQINEEQNNAEIDLKQKSEVRTIEGFNLTYKYAPLFSFTLSSVTTEKSIKLTRRLEKILNDFSVNHKHIIQKLDTFIRNNENLQNINNLL